MKNEVPETMRVIRLDFTNNTAYLFRTNPPFTTITKRTFQDNKEIIRIMNRMAHTLLFFGVVNNYDISESKEAKLKDGIWRSN